MLGYPNWATEKQLEGMRQFNAALIDYHSLFDISFCSGSSGGDSFAAALHWQAKSGTELTRVFQLAFDYEPTWNCFGVEIHDWQIVLAEGEATAEVSAEIIFVDLFQYCTERM